MIHLTALLGADCFLYWPVLGPLLEGLRLVVGLYSGRINQSIGVLDPRVALFEPISSVLGFLERGNKEGRKSSIDQNRARV